MPDTHIVLKAGSQGQAILAINPRQRKGFIYYQRIQRTTPLFSDQSLEQCILCGTDMDTVLFKGKRVCLDCIRSVYQNSHSR